ncbi:MAG: hypothetical protein RIQ94_186 [Pseudomonadota bacterium]|jgi:hypothetical protein
MKIVPKLLECLDEKKLIKVVVEDIVLSALKKVVDDSENKFDDAGYAMLAPLLAPQVEALLEGLFEKIND